MLVFVTLIVLGLVAWRAYVEPYRHERRVMELIEDLGGRYTSETRGPAWLASVFGAEHFQAVTFVDLADCDEPERYLPAISRCRWLEVLVIGGQAVDDESIERLARIAALRGLVLDSTGVTDSGVRQLREGLPDLTIHKSQRRAMASFMEMGDGTSLGTRTVTRPAVFPSSVSNQHFSVAVDAYVIDYYRSQLTDAKMALVRSFVDLESFGVNADPTAKFTDEGVRNLAAIPNLRQLSLRAGRITDQGLAWLEGKATLEEIGLWQTALTDDGLARLPLKGLKSLGLQETKITDAGLVALRQCENLQSLGLAVTGITDEGLKALQVLTKLEHLSLQDTRITDDGLSHLGEMRSLQTLMLGNTKITNAGLANLRGLIDLRGIEMGGTEIDADGLRRLRNFPKLEWVHVGTFLRESRINDAAVAELAQLKGLKELLLHGAQITDKSLAIIERDLPDLQVLVIEGTPVSAEAVNALSTARPKLQVRYYPTKKTATQPKAQ